MPNPLRILTVDDDRVDRMALRRALDGAGIEAEFDEAENVASAMEHFDHATSFDLIFLDYRLPDGTGLDLLHRIRAAGVRSPVIILTGHTDESVAVEMMKAGATDYVVKERMSKDVLATRIPPILYAHRIEEELRRTQERLHLAVAAADIGIWDWDIRGDALVWDARCRRIFGVGPDVPVTYELAASVVYPEDSVRARATTDGALERDGDLDVEYRVVCPDGSIRWVHALGRAVFAEIGGERRAVRVVGTVVDITASKRIEEVLREENDTVDTINRAGRMLTAEVDQEQILQTVADEAARLVGARAAVICLGGGAGGEAVAHMTLAGVTEGVDARFHARCADVDLSSVFENERTVRFDDVTASAVAIPSSPLRELPGGRPLHSYLAVPMIDEKGGIIGGMFFGHEAACVFGKRHERIAEGIASWAAIALSNARLVESERRLLEDAKAAVDARDEVLAIVSHDLRNPLNTIATSVALLTEFDLGDAQRERQLAIMRRASGQINRLINDLLDVTRIDVGRLTVETTPIAAEAVVEDACSMNRQVFESRGLELAFDIAPGLPPIVADRERVIQVLSNLLDNAARHTERGGAKVTAQSEGADVCFAVRDSGCGIPDDSLDHLFDRFWQARNADRAGAGLGLAIARGVVLAHGGRIWVESEIGRGTAFYFTIPAASREDGAARPQS
jgi:PAS domain S-box-containing protein